MDISNLLNDLNDAQRQAVSAPPGPLLVLAGAGSGKTRVLTHRVAWLAQAMHVSPLSMMAVTFTNKAANEMRGRIEQMLGFPIGGMWIGTFHGLSHRLLRIHWREAGLPQAFQILDSEDQLRIIRRLLKNLGLDEEYWPPKKLQWFINGHKEEGRRPQHIGESHDPQQRQYLAIYQAYEELCNRSGLVDFAELLLRAFELLQHNEPIRAHYQERFQHLLVDEFQDTNTIQYRWLRLFADKHQNMFVVGDDDQCLAAGAQVSMADGTRRPIESVQPGDRVLSGFGGGEFRPAKILERFERRYSGPLIELRTRGGRRIVSTPEHTHFAGYVYGESPQSRNLNRRNIVVTLCADARGRTPMHRISVAGIDGRDRAALEAIGLSARPAKRSSPSWRFETVRKDFGELMALAKRVKRVLWDAKVILNARLLDRSLPFIKASAISPGMVVAVEGGDFDIVERVEVCTAKCTIYDINIEATHNFVADGIVTHNSIYGWRGAKVENILKFEKDYPATTTVRLEQNYRSTANILNAANVVIGHNNGRLGKRLWTQDADGDPIRLYTAFNEIDEARFVIDRIKAWMGEGNRRDDVAILYRSNAQSRVFEETLLSAGIPYRVYGGLRFFERAEIKDALAYLRLMANREDHASFERVVNMPTRGVGNKSLDTVRERARDEQGSLWRAAKEIVQSGLLPPRATNALAGFLALIEKLDAGTQDLELAERVEHMLRDSGLIDHYRKEKGEKAQARIENLEELVSAARNFEYDRDSGLDHLSEFLAHAALEAGEGQAENWEDCVQLMSLHSAKGLEFPLVFLTGVEEGLFPHQRSLEEPGRLEEERRLCYVGMTRAMKQLYLTYAEVRRLYGRERYTSPSRFLGELPDDVLEDVRSPTHVTRPAWRPAPPRARAMVSDDTPIPGVTLGSRVRHAKFGEGVVMNYEGNGQHARVQVNFEDAGSKWLVIAYANLQPV